MLGLVQERLKFFAELPELTRFFFIDLPVNPALISEHKQLKKLSPDELKVLLEQAKATLEASDFSGDDLAFAFQHVGDDDLGTLAAEPPRGGGAHSGCRATHDRHFIGQSHGSLLRFAFVQTACHGALGLATGR